MTCRFIGALRASPATVALLLVAGLLAGCGDDASSSGGDDASGAGPGSGGGDQAGAQTGGTGGDGGASAAGPSSSSTGTGTGGATTSAAGGGGAGGDEPERTFLDSYAVPSEFPEGGIYDEGDHAFFAGSLADGSIRRIDAQTGAAELFFAPSEPGAWWTLGMAVDQAERRLWVCAMEDRSDFDESPAYDGYVWLFDLESGTREAVFPLADASPEATCTDVAVAADGTAYVTDRDFGLVYRVDPATGPSVFAADDELESSIIGQNAAVVLPDQSALLIAIYLPSRLVRVDLEDGSVLDVDIDGSFADATFLAGADGMTYADGSLYVAFTSELVRVSPVLADWSSVVAEEVDVPSGMTDVVTTPAGLYLLNGQAVRYALGEEPDPFQLVRFTGTF